MDQKTAKYSVASAIVMIGATATWFLNKVGGFPASLIGMAGSLGAWHLSNHYLKQAYQEDKPVPNALMKRPLNVQKSETLSPQHNLPNHKKKSTISHIP